MLGHPDPVVVGYDHLRPLDEPEPCLEALWAAGCTRVFLDVVPRHRSARPALDQALGLLQAGDVLVVRKLIRVALSLGHLLGVLAAVASHGADFRSLQDGLDTAVPGGELLQVVVGGLIEAKQAWTSESTRAGLDAARERGSRVGRQPTLTPQQAALARRLHASGQRSAAEIAAVLGVSRSTLYRYLKLGEDPATNR